jgi:hypothetical protein
MSAAFESQSQGSRPPEGDPAGSRRALVGTAVVTRTPLDARLAFRTALARYKGARLAAIRLAQGCLSEIERSRPAGIAEEITEHFNQPTVLGALTPKLPACSRLALGLFVVTESTSMSLLGLCRALQMLGTEPSTAILELLELGLLAIEPDSQASAVDDLTSALKRGIQDGAAVLAHPAILHAVRPIRPEGKLPALHGPVGVTRESDGLEVILRLAALWQRAGAQPLRQTEHGVLYKRDRARIVEDPVLASPVADAMAPLPGLAILWLELAQRLGVVERDESGQKLLAASPSFWSDHAVHLHQMIATAWLGLRTWHEPCGAAIPSVVDNLAVPYLRPALLLWLATLKETEWIALDDLAQHLSAHAPEWHNRWLTDALPHDRRIPKIVESPARRSRRAAGSHREARPDTDSEEPSTMAPGVRLLESILLGAAYPLGLVRAGEEQRTGRRSVQLTPLGRYILTMGPTPHPRAAFDQFLFVQPNFEMIAYRQGLTPQLAGRLSRFAWWSQIGAALELKLTRESVEFGLEGGMTAELMLETLNRHSQRPLPVGVVDAVRTWATRRERVTYYAAATLIEFGSRQDRDSALATWPEGHGEGPTAVAERFLLVDDERSIPFDRFRLVGARDYRRPPEVCVTIASDGVSMELDPARSDLLVDAELHRFADELAPADERTRSAESGPRRFVVTIASLRRGMSRGLNSHQLAEWYARRTGGEIPPAVRLLLAARVARVLPLEANRLTVLTLPTAELLDGLLQHPATCAWLGDRLGPTAVVIPEDHLAGLRKALQDIGIELDVR